MLRKDMTRFTYFAFTFGRYWFQGAAPGEACGLIE